MMFYDGYHFGGMHLFWWFMWAIMLFWIFALPYNIPGQRYRRSSPLDILHNRLASGQITTEQYKEQRQLIDSDSVKAG